MATDQLLAVTVAPGVDRARLDGLLGADHRAVRVPFADGEVWLRPHREERHRAPDELTCPGPVVIALSRDARHRDGALLSADELARRVRTGDGLADMAAPFAAMAVGADAIIGTDHLGLRHVYGAQGAGWAAVSTSAVRLAALAGGGLDHDALGAFRFLGHLLGLRTPFAAVTKLPPGQRWRLAEGRLWTLTAVESALDEPEVRTPAEMAALLRNLVESHLEHHPETVIELSGGMDSRLAVAAIPPARRVGLRALTLTAPGNADGRVAEQIAARYGMRHHVVDLTGLARLDPAEASQRVFATAARYDCAINPVNVAALNWAEEQIEPGARITGQAGEMIRGLYFLESRSPSVTPAHVRRFARWWFTRNEMVPAAGLTAEFEAHSRAALFDQLWAAFAAYHLDWRSALDEWQLRERVHRWSGTNYSGAGLRRAIGSPYFDRRFLEACRRLPTSAKNSSGFAARTMEALDPDLARLPLASGVVPSSFPRVFGEHTTAGVVAGMTRKVVQQIRPAHRSPVGADAVAAQTIQHWRANPHLLDAVAASGVVREQWLARTLSGESDADAVTVGFLANLQVATAAGAARGAVA